MNSAEVLIKFKGDTSSADNATKQLSTSLGQLTKSFTLANVAGNAINKGLQVISSNMDDAISRVDILNNYPKVMSNLGISVEDAEKSIALMSDKLIGLPTMLDEGAMAVQRFTSANGDIEKSTDMFLAVNNAILAGGAPAQIQSSALEQLSQAYAKGKPDMMEWRTLMSAMPAQLKQVATAMGYVSADELGAALRDGSITMTDFTDAIMKLNKEGLEGFQSFEEQAKNSTGGIATSVKNMKNAFVRGVASMITSVSSALEPFGGLTGVIGKIGLAGEKVFKALGKALQFIVPIIANVVSWLAKHKDLLLAILTPLAAFIATVKTMAFITTLITTIKTAVSGLFMVLSANPIALVVAAVAGLIAIFVYLWKHCEGFRNFFIGMWEAIKTVVGVVIDAIKGYFNILITVFTAVWNKLKSGAIAAWNGVKNTFSTVATFFRNIFTNAWTAVKNVFSTGGKIFDGIKEGIVTAFKTIVNGIIGGINKVVAVPFNAINKVLRKIKNVSVAGIEPFSWIHTFDVPQIPKLAVGTNLVPEDMLAMIHKGEAVVPKKFNPYANGINSSTIGSMQSGRQKPIVNVYADFSMDPLGQVVSKIKTYSGGAKNDYNYGYGG